MSVPDFMAMSRDEFWKIVDNEGEGAKETVRLLFEKAENSRLNQLEAVTGLNALFIDSHRRIREYSKALAKHYPTKQYTNHRLVNEMSLWWVDHYTAGISHWSTLTWFSAQQTEKNGKLKYNGASTHFVLGYEGYPFYIIPLCHGAWHEPLRNKDSISIEMVNAGVLKQHNQQWCYWPKGYTQPLPDGLLTALPPTRLTFDFKGHRVFQPFTASQIRFNVLLKRIILAAFPGRLDAARFSQHLDWREGKTDMGPLWPFADVNSAAWDVIPIKQYSFLSKFQMAVADGVITDAEAAEMGIKDMSGNPEYGDVAPTHDDDAPADTVMSVTELQEALNTLRYSRLTVDGKFGAKTKANVSKFQVTYNVTCKDEEKLTVDGIPGPRTCAALRKTLKG